MDAPSWMFTKALSHRQKVLRLYKRALRECDNWYRSDILENRYQKCVLRARFEETRHEKDTRKARAMLMAGCKELWEKHHPKPFEYAHSSPYGLCWQRGEWSTKFPDDIWDRWSYVEREQFPYYYNKRELRKKELLEQWPKITEAWDQELENIQKTPPKPDARETAASK